MPNYFTNYPKHVLCILVNEFCERFSFYGLRAILIIYLWKAIGLSENTSTAVYHAFVVVSYFSPILGAIIADQWLGKCKTIIYVSILYALGNLVMTLTAIPVNDSYYVYGAAVGLFLIAFGTGGIKPCVSSFGGDQFNDDQKRQKESFFSFFYMAVNCGSLLSTIITPSIRGNFYCFNTSCYSLAFGIPAILMVIAILVFVAAIRWYKILPPSESIIMKLMKCIAKALGRRFCCRKTDSSKKKEHWLDYAEPDYDRDFISDVKAVTRVTWLFLPLPIFWTLFDQQGSKWTLQAAQMNGEVNGFTFEPDLVQVLNPLMVVLIVPILESTLYPCMVKIGRPFKPLQRMSVGVMLAAFSFVIAAIIQAVIDKDQPIALAAGQSKVRFINTSPCALSVSAGHAVPLTDIDKLESTQYFYLTAGDLNLTVSGTQCANPTNHTVSLNLAEKRAFLVFLGSDEKFYKIEQTQVTLTPKIQSTVRFYNSLDIPLQVSMKTVGNKEDKARDFGKVSSHDASTSEDIIISDYYVTVTIDNATTQRLPTNIKPRNGALYTLIIYNETSASSAEGDYTNLKMDVVQLTDIEPWSVTILLQIPQYFAISLGECLFSITGLSFSYTQAPVSMKSFLSAIWLMTVAIGNTVVIIVAEADSGLQQVYEFVLFAGLMVLTTLIFIAMACSYKYIDRTSQDDSSLGSEDNEAEEAEIKKQLEDPTFKYPTDHDVTHM